MGDLEKKKEFPPKGPDIPSSTKESMLDSCKRLAPHIFIGIRMLGWTEFNHDKELTKYGWPATTDCRSLTTVIGSSSAWCSG